MHGGAKRFTVAPFPAGAGRGSVVENYLGLDVGNSRLSVALVTRDGRPLALTRADTPPRAEDAVERLLGLARETLDQAAETPLAVGVGFGGPVDLASGRLRGSFLSSGWEGLPLAEVIAQGLGLPAWLANDADAGGLAEALFGAGRDADSVLYVNVGTGIGGAVVLGGRLHTGATSSAGEIGHFIVIPRGPECECGKRGCAQALASGTAIARRTQELLAESAEPSELRDAQITGRAVGEAARRGDALARRVVGEAAGWLGIAIANAAHLLDPERIVMGGGVAEMGETFLGPLRASYRANIFGPPRGTRIVSADLGYDAGVIGAAAVAMTGQGARAEP